MERANRVVTVSPLFLSTDARGRLTAGAFPGELPFQPVRYFVLFDVPAGQARGEHAHRDCHQFFVALGGSVTISVDDGLATEEIVLDRPDAGLHVPPMVWTKLFNFSPGAMLLVFASGPYDPAEYIRSYEEFGLLRGRS